MRNTIGGGNGDDDLVGGATYNEIPVGDGNDTVFGDDGLVTYDSSARHLHAATLDVGIGGTTRSPSAAATTSSSAGQGGDTISSTGGHNVVFGDDGDVSVGGRGRRLRAHGDRPDELERRLG